jgi:hypothetical protein
LNPTSPVALTVVVPSVNGFTDLERALTALVREAADVPMEILVVDRCGDVVRAQVRKQFPQARLIAAPPDATIPAMRCLAFDAARGDSVAVIEDHVIVPPGWARAMLEAQRENPVVGGAVENAATERTVDWAAFLCEYSHCILPLPAGPSEWLTGNNVVYPRALLQRYRSRLSSDQWENHLHAMMRADGVVLMCRPDIVVGHRKHYTIGEYFSQRYLYARSYAGARIAGAGLARRVAFGAAAFALPPVLFQRTVSRVLQKKRHRAELVRGLPLIAIFVCAWAAGDVMGSWFGTGDSLQKVC